MGRHSKVLVGDTGSHTRAMRCNGCSLVQHVPVWHTPCWCPACGPTTYTVCPAPSAAAQTKAVRERAKVVRPRPDELWRPE